MDTACFLWPEGRKVALVSCWDDGTEHDRRLVEILNRHGLKGSFNLNSGKLGLDREQSGWKNFIRADEVSDLYAGHEICAHTVNHPYPWALPPDQLRWEMVEDRKRLEALAGYPVRGFVLPFGWRSGFERAKEFARACGFKYMRRTEPAPHFEPPADFLDWKPTCHCRDNLTTLWRGMVDNTTWPPGRLFYVWGHSYEFEDHQAWGPFETFAATVRDTPGVWHATKGDLYDYVEAWRRLEWSLDGTIVRNPSACSVWFWRKNKAVCVGGGDSLRMD